jgi:hypothetical protein
VVGFDTYQREVCTMVIISRSGSTRKQFAMKILKRPSGLTRGSFQYTRMHRLYMLSEYGHPWCGALAAETISGKMSHAQDFIVKVYSSVGKSELCYFNI